MNRRKSWTGANWGRYALALIGFLAVSGALLPFRGALGNQVIVLLYLLLVVLTTVRWGLRPGILVAVCAFLAFNYFFIPPYLTLAVHDPSDFLSLVVFFVVAIVVNQLLGQSRASLAEATAREREATLLYEVSAALAGLQEVPAVADALAARAAEAFATQYAEVRVAGHGDDAGLSTVTPAGSRAPAGDPNLSESLVTARGIQGEIRLWRPGGITTEAERRLLRAFAAQGAMAVERAQLAQAETRAEVLAESDKMKSSLLSSVSHELRSPLASIKAAVTSLRGGEVKAESPAGQDLLLVVDEEVDLLNRLVGNLLDMSRIESGALRPQRQWDILAEVVSDVAFRLRRAAAQHRLAIDVPDDLPLVPIDRGQLEQVFTNLLSNSLKHAPAGTPIRVSARRQDDRCLLVRVSNQGPHVAQEHLARMFDKFARVARDGRLTGAGLGLSICKGIVEAHGGRIWAENVPGGLDFNFTLPLDFDGAPPHLPDAAEAT